MSAERSLSTKIERPALAAVLARLTGKPPERFANVKDVHELGVSTRPSYKCIPWAKMAPVFEARRVGKRLVRVQVQAARVMGAGEALTELYEAGLWPWEPGDVDAPRWSCATCSGNGTTENTRGNVVCDSCIGTGCFTSARSFASQVAVASLGVPMLTRIIGLSNELVDGTATVRFCVIDRDEIVELHRSVPMNVTMPILMASTQEAYRADMRAEEPADFVPAWTPRPNMEEEFSERELAEWAILRDIHQHADESPTGVHLFNLDRRNVTLAVEAV